MNLKYMDELYWIEIMTVHRYNPISIISSNYNLAILTSIVATPIMWISFCSYKVIEDGGWDEECASGNLHTQNRPCQA